MNTPQLRYPWQYFDGGKRDSKRPKNLSDCSVIAWAAIHDIPYDDAYSQLTKECGRKCSESIDIKEWKKLLARHSGWIPFQAVKGHTRMNIATFCEIYKSGKYIIRTAGHLSAVIDGVVHSVWHERSDRCVYGCWKID